MTNAFVHLRNNIITGKKTLPIVNTKLFMKPLFSNNHMVAYKPHSLAPGGVGTVRNSRFKSKNT